MAHNTKSRRRAKRDKAWLPIPAAIGLYMAKVHASGAAWALLICLLTLEFKAWKKGEPLILSSAVLKEWEISRGQKGRALRELEAIGVISFSHS